MPDEDPSTPTREEYNAILFAARDSCECPAEAHLMQGEHEGDKLLCGACKARKWLSDGIELADSL